VLSAKKTEHFRQLLETRIAESERILANAEQEVRAGSARHADSSYRAATCDSYFAGTERSSRGVPFLAT
jgi:hypothetical protein